MNLCHEYGIQFLLESWNESICTKIKASTSLLIWFLSFEFLGDDCSDEIFPDVFYVAIVCRRPLLGFCSRGSESTFFTWQRFLQ